MRPSGKTQAMNLAWTIKCIVSLIMSEEMLEIVNSEGVAIGLKPRSEIHGNPELLHKVIHILVFNDAGELLLQKRSMSKDVAPGKWDTSVGGHFSPGEDSITSAKREMEEELGVISENYEFLYTYFYRNNYESELVHTLRCFHNGPFSFNHEEIDDIAFWSMDEIRKTIGRGLLSDNFEVEIGEYFSKT
jgi:isopentenyldiphosphate isomerase